MNIDEDPGMERLDVLKIDEVRPERWQAVLASIPVDDGQPRPVLATTDAVKQYFRDKPHPLMLAALQVVHALGNPRGIEAINRAIKAYHLPYSFDKTLDGPCEEAVRFWQMSLVDKAMESALTLALHIASKTAQQKFFEYFGEKPQALPLATAVGSKEQLTAALVAYLEDKGISGTTQITFNDYHGEVLITILRADKRMVFHENVATGAVRKSVVPAVYDLIRYNPSTGMLAVRARAAMIDTYRSIIGHTLFGKSDFFANAAVLDLTHFRTNLVVQAARGFPGVIDAKVIQLQFKTDHGRTSLSSGDCFRQAVAEGRLEAIRDATITQVKLKVVFAGKTKRNTCTIELAPENNMKFVPPEHEEKGRALLRRIQVLRGRSADSPINAFPVHGWATHEQWVSKFSSASVAGWKGDGYLISRPPDEAQEMADRGVAEMVSLDELPGGKTLVAIGSGPDASVTLFVPDELKMYSLDQAKIVRGLASGLRIDGIPPREVVPGRAWDLGQRTFRCSRSAHCFMVLADLSAQEMQLLRTRGAAAEKLVLVTPHGADFGCLRDVHTLSLQLPMSDTCNLLYRLVTMLHWGGHVDVDEWSNESHPLIIVPSKEMLIFEGKQILLSSDKFLQVMALVKANGGDVSGSQLAPGMATDAKTLIKRLKQELPERLQEAIKPGRKSRHYRWTTIPTIL